MSAATQARKLTISARPKTRPEAGGVSAGNDFDFVTAGQRLGLTQEQLARALNLPARSPRHLNAGRGSNQPHKRIRDVHQLLSRMDEYVVASQENQWLSSRLEIFGGRSPRELIVDGRIRDLLAEFDRLRDGLPA